MRSPALVLLRLVKPDGLLSRQVSINHIHDALVMLSAADGVALHQQHSGQVTFVGGNPCCSYGYHVIIDLGNGYETLYAHMSTFAVESGAWVNAGDVIGYIGLTGRTTGPHVHFELRRNGVYQDPLNYLP